MPTVHLVQKVSGIQHFQTTRTGLSDARTRQPCFLSSCSMLPNEIPEAVPSINYIGRQLDVSYIGRQTEKYLSIR